MLESQDRYPLQNIILDDLFSANKTLIALLFFDCDDCIGHYLDYASDPNFSGRKWSARA
ncbi:hypothetical protein KCU_00729 [Pasteurella multocida subsp. multocida str. P52VAC]|nr:hypothetical protein KCU_00729 [Pasteurella multocida subsp. multocida str. P52VAC]